MHDESKLSPEDLGHPCDPESLGFETTADIPPIEGMVGQERAVASIEFGLGIRTEGFNLYVAGRPGTGRSTSVTAQVSAKAKQEPPGGDWCYVHNFRDPYRPRAIRLEPGKGPEFAGDMEEFARIARTEIPRAFDSENYGKRRTETLDTFQRRKDALLEELQQKAADLGFAVEATAVGIASVPLTSDGRPYTREEFDALPDDEKQEIKKRGGSLQDDINQFISRSRALEKEAQDKLHELDKEIALFAVGHLLQDMRAKYTLCEGLGDCEAILDYLQLVENDIVERLDDFRSPDKRQQGLAPAFEEFLEPSFDRYKVNVFLTRHDSEGAPVVWEQNPTYSNLLGKIDYKARFGFMSTDHNMIKPGAVHRANGGYLVLQALEVLLSPFAWDALKRVLRSGEAAPENLADQYGLVSVATLRPQPIPLDLKVILIGSPLIYYLLYHLDDEFRKLFKVKADFDIEVARDDEHVGQYAAFVAGCYRRSGLKPFEKGAVARVVDFGSRLIEDKQRLSTRFIEIADIVSESAHWAERAGAEIVMAGHVEEALQRKEHRSRLIEDKLQALIEEGVIMIDVDGSAVGQANGLSVYDMGDYSFARPSRLTVRVSVGKGRIIDIQRESEMGGRIHSKGVMILSGYLGGKYGATKPIAMQATIAFEQLYEEVEGDSASSTELYALLSALSGLPIRQGIAVTGSVDQFGRIQPVGGANRKIEGFYEVCKALCFTGEQGVVIPRSNLRHLMLRQEVVEAVRKGRFNVWAVEAVDQGIEILTGVPAGEELPGGAYPEGSVHHLVAKRLAEFAEAAREFEAREGLSARAPEKEPAARMKAPPVTSPT